METPQIRGIMTEFRRQSECRFWKEAQGHQSEEVSDFVRKREKSFPTAEKLQVWEVPMVTNQVTFTLQGSSPGKPRVATLVGNGLVRVHRISFHQGTFPTEGSSSQIFLKGGTSLG